MMFIYVNIIYIHTKLFRCKTWRFIMKCSKSLFFAKHLSYFIPKDFVYKKLGCKLRISQVITLT